ncbi:MAG: PIN domain-containing protein [Phycisphaerae bacterium]|nr:PIN domain-containing protein [Phycisphaerae bacterium]
MISDRITARSVPAEPKVSETLPWLDPSNNDDRFLASVIEVIRENVRSVVVIVTGDINLQNKARFARIPFCEPPGETSPACT